jgi:peptidoglycan/LPS O-acetylase OafA/YrhL
MSTGKPAYRADIDGLRAIAILAVVVFHAFPSSLTGGFVGVDVFFVISGYLISGIIFRGLRDGTFSFAEFYAHRVKRIFPALVTMLAASFAFSWLVLLPDEFAQFGKHMAAGAGFVLNFVLWGEAGYFDTASELKPLMHLWSLAIEEQFYLVYPLIMWAAWRVRSKVLCILLLMAGASFALNIWGISRDAAETFFFPQSRFWELLAGGLLAYAHVFWPHGAARASVIRDAAALVGFGLIGYAAFHLTGESLFPGWAALTPVAGSFLLIAAGPKSRFNRWVLASAPMVFIGKISYPLYLWHWPVLSFGQIIAADTTSPTYRAAALLISLLLSILTFNLVERPLRFGRGGVWKTAGLCASLAVAGAAGFNAFEAGGLRDRNVVALNASAVTATLGAGKDMVDQTCGTGPHDGVKLDFCYRTKGKPATRAIWGDSKGDALYWGMVREASNDGGWMIIGRAACAPMAGVERVSKGAYPPEECARANEWALHQLVADSNIKLVLIVSAQRIVIGEKYAKGPHAQPYAGAALEGIRNAVSALEKAGKRVVFVVDNPTLPDPKVCMPGRLTDIELVNALVDRQMNPACNLTYAAHLEKTITYRALLADLRKANAKVMMFDPTPFFCDEAKDVCPMSRGGNFLYSYGDHISDYANGEVAKEIAKVVGPAS